MQYNNGNICTVKSIDISEGLFCREVKEEKKIPLEINNDNVDKDDRVDIDFYFLSHSNKKYDFIYMMSVCLSDII
jgi:hypothetical protein